jgi:hypothetical protein
MSIMNYKDIELYLFIKPIFLKYKRCNIPNSLICKEKAIISDGLSSVAPLTELELRNDKNLTQNLTQTSRRNRKGPTI